MVSAYTSVAAGADAKIPDINMNSKPNPAIFAACPCDISDYAGVFLVESISYDFIAVELIIGALKPFTKSHTPKNISIRPK